MVTAGNLDATLGPTITAPFDWRTRSRLRISTQWLFLHTHSRTVSRRQDSRPERTPLNRWPLFCVDARDAMLDKPELLPAVMPLTVRNRIEAGPVLQITPSERYALQLIAQGATPVHIGEMLGLDAADIDPFLAALFARLGATSHREAIHVASRRGLLMPAPNSGANDAFARTSNEHA